MRIVTVVLLAIFSFLLPYLFGGRGLVYHDQSIIIDGAWRIWNGQIPYRDFSVIHGPLIFYLQVLAFKVFGLWVFSAVIQAAVLNAVATLLTYWGVKRFLQMDEFWAIGAALLTAYWFFTPLSWPWFETVGYLCFLISCLLIWSGRSSTIFLAGVFIGLALLSKANMALAVLLVCPAVLYLLLQPGNKKRGSFWFLAGALSLLMSWFFYLVVTGSLGGAWVDLFVRASRINRFDRITALPLMMVENSLTLFVFIAGCCFWIEKDWQKKRANGLAALLGIFQIVVGLFSAAAATENNIVFIGWMWVLLVRGLPWQDLLSMKKQKVVFTALLAVFMIFGHQTGYYRVCWQYGFGSIASSAKKLVPLSHPRLKNILVQLPYGSELKELLDWCEQEVKKEDRIFVIPAINLLYFVLDKVPPHPYVILAPDFSLYRDLGDEDRLIASLEKSKPQWIILEKHEQVLGHNTLSQFFGYFPNFLECIKRDYVLYKSLSGYDILRNKT